MDDIRTPKSTAKQPAEEKRPPKSESGGKTQGWPVEEHTGVITVDTTPVPDANAR